VTAHPTATVLLFAQYAEMAGTASVEVPVGTGADVRAVLGALRASVPGAASLPEGPLCAVNHRQAELGAPVRAGDVVAFLPPLAGG
jgi:molybdopterin synthase sulfur carrier subunit